MLWKVTAPNPNYSGRAMGVRFTQGSAFVDAKAIDADASLDLTVQQVVQGFRRELPLYVIEAYDVEAQEAEARWEVEAQLKAEADAAREEAEAELRQEELAKKEAHERRVQDLMEQALAKLAADTESSRLQAAEAVAQVNAGKRRGRREGEYRVG